MNGFYFTRKLFNKCSSLFRHGNVLCRLKRNSCDFVNINLNYPLNSYYFCCFYSTKLKQGYSSKYYPKSSFEVTETKLTHAFMDKTSLTTEEWKKMKSQLLISLLTLTDENFDSIVMNVMLSLNNIQLAHSFMAYLEETCKKPNLVTSMKYMALCSRHLNNDSERIILKTYNNIKNIIESSPVLDQISLNYVVQGLCATYHWRRTFDFLEKLPGKNYQSDTLNAIICAALRNDEEQMAWDFMIKHYKHYEHPNNNVIKNYVAYATRLLSRKPKLADQVFMKFMTFVKKRNVTLKMQVLDEIKLYFKSHPRSWIISDAKVNRLGVCSGCHKTLESPQLTLTEYTELEKHFFSKVVKKSDVYINSTEEEMQHFLQFIETTKPFDMVIDGLNAAHLISEKGFRGSKPLAKQLRDVVNKLSLTSKRILVLGKHFMVTHWPRHIMNAIRKKAYMYFVNDITQDDPMTIYAALASGPNTLFVSSDLVRDHIARLDDARLSDLFQKWQQSRQVYLMLTEDEEVIFKGPLKHHISIQGDMKFGWHFPYDDEFVLEPYEVLNNWLCIQPHS